MNRKYLFGVALVVLVMVLAATAYKARSTTEATTGVETPWNFDGVDNIGDVGWHVSVAIAPDTGTTYVSYYDFTKGNLKMATYVGSGGIGCADDAWKCEVIDDGSEDVNEDAINDDVGRYSSIAVNPVTKEPAIAYYDLSNGSLKLAKMIGDTWYISTIQSEDHVVGLYASLAFDSNGKPHIAYLENKSGGGGLWYVEYVGRTIVGDCSNISYQCTKIDDGQNVGAYASLAMDSADRPHIAYHHVNNNQLMYAYYNGSTWIKYDILPIDGGQYASLVVDTEHGDKKHIAHYNRTSGALEFAEYIGVSTDANCGHDGYDMLWRCDKIEDVSMGYYPLGISMAVDKAGYPMIAYQSGDNAIKTARPVAALGLPYGNCGPIPGEFTWQCDILRLGFGVTMGDYVALAINSANLPTIAYYGGTTTNPGNLYVAYKQLRLFLPFTLDD